MSNEDLRYARQQMEMRVADEHRQAEGRRLQKLASASQSSATVAIGDRLLRRAALVLVSVGGRLVRLGLPPYRPPAVGLSQRTRN
jgi:hypothetical protein